MSFQLRIARTPFDVETTVHLGQNPLGDYYPRLFSLISKRAPEVTVGLLAKPVTSENGKMREWYSDFSGQPTSLLALPDAARAQAELLIDDRLAALRRIADAFEADGKKGEAVALRLACRPPTPNMIYVVAGQPVMVDWDRTRADVVPQTPKPAPVVAPPPSAPRTQASSSAEAAASTASEKTDVTQQTAPPTPKPVSVRRTGFFVVLFLALALLAGAAIGAAYYLQWGPFEKNNPRNSEREQLEKEIAKLEAELKKRLSSCPSIDRK